MLSSEQRCRTAVPDHGNRGITSAPYASIVASRASCIA
jgi:hypothetical protein